MKNIFYTFLFFVAFLSNAQRTPINTATNNEFHDTQGNLDISSSGSVNYTLPIAMPPTIGDFAPAINLVYSSGQFGGIAGQGWNITGISAIMRTATRRDIDGIIDGVDFDTNDKLSLDGQRLLLKSGTYFANGAEYMTETQSNSKIEQVNTDATTYFVVTAPDGTRSWYGNYGGMNAIEHTAYYIVRQEDTDGNFITYHYGIPAVYGKSLCLSEIRFSANTVSNNTPLNKITFTYKKAIRSEFAYIGGVKKEKTELLSQVVVSTNNLQFKKYVLTHAIDSQLGYEKVIKIQEFNSNNEAANPVEFEYGNTVSTNVNSEISKQYNLNLDFSAINLSGDFDGDGFLDLCSGNGIYTQLFQNTQNNNPVSIPNNISNNGKKFVATTIKNHKLNTKNSIIIPNEEVGSMSFSTYNLENNQLVFQNTKTINKTNRNGIFDNRVECMRWVYGNYVPGNCNEVTGQTITPSDYHLNASDYLEGDFNGDGISEVLWVRKKTQFVYHCYSGGDIPKSGEMQQTESNEQWNCPVVGINNPNDTWMYLVDLNENSSNVINTQGCIRLLSYPDIRKDNTYIGDFNGDGKSDILTIEYYQYKLYNINFLNAAPWAEIELIGEGTIPEYQLDKPFLLGDYNGDGKLDFMLPNGNGNYYKTISIPNPIHPSYPPLIGKVYDPNPLWHIYYSNPKSNSLNHFDKENHVIIDYWKDTQDYFERGKQFQQFYAIDYNKDGKTDLVNFWANQFAPMCTINDWDTQWEIKTFTNNIGNSNITSSNKFTSDYISPITPTHCLSNWCVPWQSPNCYNKHYSDSPEMVRPIVSNYRYASLNTEILLYRKHHNRVTYINFTKDVARDNRLLKVKHANGVIQDEIIYQELLPSAANNGLGSNSDFYSSTNALNYPFVEMDKMPNSYMVSQIKNTAMGLVRYQDFKYQGFVVNMHGLGGLGFTKTARSSWYRDSNDKKMWSVQVNNPLQRMANAYSYTQLLPGTQPFSFTNAEPTSGANGVLSLSNNSYTQSIDPTTKLYTILMQSQSSKDFLKGTISSKSLEYYPTTNLFKKTISTNALLATPTAFQSTSTSEYFYFNNPTGQGADYFIGRPQRVYSKIEAYNDTKESEELFSYTGNRLTKTEKKPLASNYYLTEEFDYFTNGLLKKKTLSAPGAYVTSRKTEYTYDATNRFIQTTKDNEDFVTTNNSFHPIYGLVTQTTNHFNQSTYFVYDNWGKQTKVTDFLNKNINYTYTKANGLYTTTQIGDDGNKSKSIADALGRTLIKGSTDINNNWVVTQTEYDWLDRKYRESEPYFEATQTPTQWNTTFYDDYSRPWKTVAHTGLTGTVDYSGGLTVSTYDGFKTVTTTLNANGHKTSSTDPGGTINYSYFADGNLKQTVYEEVTLTMTYDDWGRKASLNDPSAGLYTYTYNAFGEVLQETTPKGITDYSYTPSGKIETKQVVGDGTDIMTVYNYNADKMLLSIEVNDAFDGIISSYTYTYDNHKRLIKTIETQPQAVYENIVNFDDFGRPATQELKARHLPTNKTSNTKTRNVYKNGHRWKLQNFANNQDLWITTTTNARGQLTQGNYGNAINVSNEYDSFGFPQRQRHTYGTAVRMDLQNTFEPTRGLLQNRTNSLFNFTESFQYDNLERLTHTYKNGTLVEQQVYDNKGRITNNNTGNYAYENAAKPYQNTKIANSNNLFRLKVDYNAFKSPVSIGINRTSNPEIYRFTYNTFHQRSRMLYSINSRFRTLPTIKNYSADGHIEIKNTGSNVEFVTYLAGDAYSSNIVVKSDGVTQNFLYLHRDYLGSIVAISNQAGDVVEKRHFDAWGSLKNLEQNGIVRNITATNIYDVNLLLDRGYTGHEHLLKAGLIHMNGRLYDPLMHRFLQPDNYVQDPSNTQNYNRYGYVLNNPLKYSDPTGEEFVTAVAIAVFAAAATYTISALVGPPVFSWCGFMKTVTMAFVSSFITFGIGEGVSTITNFWTKTAVSALAHGTVQGGLSEMQGGKFINGFASGALSSVAASLWQGGSTSGYKWEGGLDGGLEFSVRNYQGISGFLGAKNGVGTVLFGAISGGAGASMSGGNFWQGALTGAIVAGLNHEMHGDGDGPGDPKKAKAIQPKKQFNFAEHIQFRHLLGPDAIMIAASQEINAIGSAGTELGFLIVLQGSEKGIYPIFDWGFGGGGISGSAGIEAVKLYYSGKDVKARHFLGNRFELNIGAEILGKIGLTGVFANVGNGHYVFGYGFSLGVGFSPHAINGNLNYGETIYIGEKFGMKKL